MDALCTRPWVVGGWWLVVGGGGGGGGGSGGSGGGGGGGGWIGEWCPWVMVHGSGDNKRRLRVVVHSQRSQNGVSNAQPLNSLTRPPAHASTHAPTSSIWSLFSKKASPPLVPGKYT
jgi:hypothetical protein